MNLNNTNTTINYSVNYLHRQLKQPTFSTYVPLFALQREALAREAASKGKRVLHCVSWSPKLFSYCSGVGSAVDFQPKIDCRLGLGGICVLAKIGVFGGRWEFSSSVCSLFRRIWRCVWGAGRAGRLRGRAGEFAGAGR